MENDQTRAIIRYAVTLFMLALAGTGLAWLLQSDNTQFRQLAVLYTAVFILSWIVPEMVEEYFGLGIDIGIVMFLAVLIVGGAVLGITELFWADLHYSTSVAWVILWTMPPIFGFVVDAR